MDDYQQEKLKRLESFEYKVRTAMRNIGFALHWIWVVFGVGIPTFVWFRPIPDSAAIQAVLFAVLIWFLFIVSVIMKYVGNLEGEG